MSLSRFSKAFFEAADPLYYGGIRRVTSSLGMAFWKVDFLIRLPKSASYYVAGYESRWK